MFWKKRKETSVLVDITNVGDEVKVISSDFWVQNDLYFLKQGDKNILLSPSQWLNDVIMDASQRLICHTLGSEQNYQSVLNSQKNFTPVEKEHVQLLHDGGNHWLLTFCSGERVQVCDSLRSRLSPVAKRSMKDLYKTVIKENGKLNVTFLPVQKQADGYNCGLFAVAYAADVLAGTSPIESYYDVQRMRPHLMECLVNKNLSPFPKVHKRKRMIVNDAINIFEI